MKLGINPARREALEEVVTLHAAVVIGARHVGRIERDKIDVGVRNREGVATCGTVVVAVVKNQAVEQIRPLTEMLLESHSQVSSAIVVAPDPTHGEHPRGCRLRHAR